jgi:hypothetical protein
MQQLSIVSALLVEYGLVGLLVSMPPALLLALGFRKKNRATTAFGGLCFLSLAALAMGLTLGGIGTGSGLALSHSTLMVERTENPVFFWVSTAAFGMISIALLALGCYCLWRSATSSGAARIRLTE